MKQILFYEIRKWLRSKPVLMRKIKIIAIAGVISFVVIGGLTIWMGIAAFNYVASRAGEVVSAPQVKEQLGNLAAGAKDIERVDVLGCWDQAQSLASVRPWLENTVVDNFKTLTVACLGLQKESCEGAECGSMHNESNSTKREVTI